MLFLTPTINIKPDSDISSLPIETFEKPGDFHHPQKDDELFWSDWWKGAVFGAMRRGQNSPMDTLLKRPAREPWNWKKAHRL